MISQTPVSKETEPEREISETILDFGQPLLGAFDFEAPIDVVHAAHEYVVTVWNAHVMAMPIWGNRSSWSRCKPPYARPSRRRR